MSIKIENAEKLTQKDWDKLAEILGILFAEAIKFKLKEEKEVKPKKIDVVEEMDRIERRESLEEGKKP